MKLYKLFSVGLVALIALLVSALTVQAANSANKRAFVVPSHCTTIRAFFVGHRLELVPSGSDDDACGFNVRTSFLPKDIAFAAPNLAFDLQTTGGAALDDAVLVRCFATQNNGAQTFFATRFQFNNHWLFDFTTAGITNPDFIEVSVNDFDSPGNSPIIFATNFQLGHSFFPGQDMQHVDPAPACN